MSNQQIIDVAIGLMIGLIAFIGGSIFKNIKRKAKGGNFTLMLILLITLIILIGIISFMNNKSDDSKEINKVEINQQLKGSFDLSNCIQYEDELKKIIEDCIEQLNKTIETKLASLDTVEDLSSVIEIKNSCLDTNKKEYEQCILFTPCKVVNAGTIKCKYFPTPIYKLEGKYKHFISTLSMQDFTLGNEDVAEIGIEVSIYGDDKLLYNGNINYGDAPINLDIDISNVKQLKILFPKYEETFIAYKAILSNAIVTN